MEWRHRPTGIHPPTLSRYPDGMSAADPLTPAPRRVSIRLPRPLWIGVATVVFVIVVVGLRGGVPIYRQARAINEIRKYGGSILDRRRVGPEWLRERLGEQ